MGPGRSAIQKKGIKNRKMRPSFLELVRNRQTDAQTLFNRCQDAPKDRRGKNKQNKTKKKQNKTKTNLHHYSNKLLTGCSQEDFSGGGGSHGVRRRQHHGIDASRRQRSGIRVPGAAVHLSIRKVGIQEIVHDSLAR